MRTLKKILSAVITLAVVLTIIGPVKVQAANFTLINGSDALIYLEPGKTTHYEIPVKFNTIDYSTSFVYMEAVPSNPNTMKVENFQLMTMNKGIINIENGGTLYSSVEYLLSFDVESDECMKIGFNSISINANVYDDDSSDLYANTQLINLRTYTAVELSPVQLGIQELHYNADALQPNSTLEMEFVIRNDGDAKALNAFMSLEFGNSGIVPGYLVENVKLGDIAGHSSVSKKLSVRVLPEAAPGLKPITAKFTAKDRNGQDYTGSSTVYVIISDNSSSEGAKKTTPVLELTTDDNYKKILKGTEDKITITVKNAGEANAEGVVLACKSGMGASTGITKNYTTETLKVGNIAAGKTKKVEVPFIVADGIASGLYEMKFEASCIFKAEGKADVTIVSQPMTMYLEKEKSPTDNESEKDAIHNYITISGVSQSPAVPQAGEKLTVSFTLTNEGNADISHIHVSGANLSSSGFEPLSNEPYQDEGALKTGESKKISMTFNVGKDIPTGVNPLNITYSYINAADQQQSGSETFHILSVENPFTAKNNIGRPKLIISEYGADSDILKAGNTFDFSFTLKNTHQTKSARNIKITLSQAEGVFAPTAGTNIFYVNEIPAGGTSEQSINLKTRADAATGDYEITLLVEYEYDNMSEQDQEHGGVSESNAVKLRATENYRPVIENVYVADWDVVAVGSPADLSLEFYNMGKSTLGNVYITIEGDFELANNSAMNYVGAVQGYGQEYINPQIVPLVSGLANGIVTVHFEDSNGDEQTISSNFSAFVEEGNGMGDFGGEYNWDDPFYGGEYGGEFGGEFGGEEPEDEGGKFLGLKWWIWVIIGCGVAAAAVVTVVCVKKAKKKNEDDDEDI